MTSPSNNTSFQDLFHDRVRQHGHELISSVSDQIGGTPSGLSITLETIKMPGFPIFWAWSVGCANRSIELAVYAFFQTDQGKAILNVADGVEFKFGIALLVLPPSSQAPGYCPTGFTAATFPLQEDHEAVIIPPTSSSLPRSHVCIRAMTGGWLQTAPHTDLKPHLLVKPRDPQASESS